MAVLGDYVDLVRGKTYKGSLVGQPGPALLGLGSIVPGGGFRSDFKTYGGECPPELMLEPGDLFVSLKGATKDGEMIGSVARVPKSVPSGRLTQDTVRLVFRERNRQFERFIYWLLRTPAYRAYCAGRATGSAVVALSRADFLSYPVPDLTRERSLIISAVEGLDDKIESNRRARRIADALGDALWTVLANRTTDRVSLDKLISSGGIRLSDGYRTRSDELGTPGLPILRVADMVDDHYALPPEGERIHNALSAKYSEKIALPGDACVTTKGTVGRTALVRRDDPHAVYSPQLCFLRAAARSPLPPSALYRWLRSSSFRSQALTVQHQTDMAAYVSLADFRRFKIPLVDPLADELPTIEALDDVVTHLRAEVAALVRTRDALIPELLSDAIRVPEVADVIQDVVEESESA